MRRDSSSDSSPELSLPVKVSQESLPEFFVWRTCVFYLTFDKIWFLGIHAGYYEINSRALRRSWTSSSYWKVSSESSSSSASGQMKAFFHKSGCLTSTLTVALSSFSRDFFKFFMSFEQILKGLNLPATSRRGWARPQLRRPLCRRKRTAGRGGSYRFLHSCWQSCYRVLCSFQEPTCGEANPPFSRMGRLSPTLPYSSNDLSRPRPLRWSRAKSSAFFPSSHGIRDPMPCITEW